MTAVWLLGLLLVLGWALTWLGVELLAREGASRLMCQTLLAVGLGVTPVLVVNAYVRLAPLGLPDALSQSPAG